jgi:hypothetical protein
MSIIWVPETPTVPALVTAEAPVNLTDPKSAKETKDPPSSKSSTIHSALVSHKVPVLPSPLNECVLLFPEELFKTVAFPPVLLLAVTVTVIESPSLMVKPEKSYE